MFRRLFPLLKVILGVAVIYLAGDTFIIRSGVYLKFTEPESIAGSVLLNRSVIQRRWDATRDNVLVLGDSQVAEGFSARIANEMAKGSRLNFIGCGISGSTPRVWHYFLRAVDPDRKKFAAIVLMAAAYSDDESLEDFANRALDINYCLPLLGWSDLQTFPQTFSKPAIVTRAEHAIAFPLAFFQSDLKALMAHPLDRSRKVKLWQSGYPDWISDYPGRPDAVPNLHLEGSPLHPENYAGVSDALRANLQGYFAYNTGQYPVPPSALAAKYRNTWYGTIANTYRAAGIPVYVFLMPRGPFHHQLLPPPKLTGVFADFAAKKTIRFLPPAAFAELEFPENFFDQFHLNAVGRTKLTTLIAHDLIEGQH